MKIIIYLGVFFLSFSCKKPNCPEPVTIQPVINQSTTTQPTIIQPTTSKLVTLTLQPGNEGKDALLSSVYPDDNFSTRSYLHARAWTAANVSVISLEKGIIKFDYSSIPTGALIKKAILTLFADTTLNTGSIGHSQLSGPNDWVLKRVTQSWDETKVTWNNQPTTDAINMIQCPASTSASQAYSLDVTSWVQDEIANPGHYYGFLMELNSQEFYRAINFCSSNNKYQDLHPKMVIEYIK